MLSIYIQDLRGHDKYLHALAFTKVPSGIAFTEQNITRQKYF